MKVVHFLSGDVPTGRVVASGSLFVGTAGAPSALTGGCSARRCDRGLSERRRRRRQGRFARLFHHAETERVLLSVKLDRVERQLVGGNAGDSAGLGERRRELLVVECGLTRAVFGVDQDELRLPPGRSLRYQNRLF